MMSKIQNLNGTHNEASSKKAKADVVYDVKDTKFEWNSQRYFTCSHFSTVVYDVKDTKFEWNSQPTMEVNFNFFVVYDVKDTKFEWNSQRRGATNGNA